MKKYIFVGIAAIATAFLFLVLTGEKKDDGELPGGTTTSVKLGTIPDNADIIFWSTRDVKNAHILGPSNLYVMDENGGSIKQITFKTDHYEHAAVSFGRRHIAAARLHYDSGEGLQSLWVIDLEKKTEAQLVPSFYTAGVGGIDWDSRGFIYFAGQDTKGGAQNIYKIKPDGSELTQLTNLAQKAPPYPEPAYYSDVSVSEDGAMVAAFRYRAVHTGDTFTAHPEVWVMNANGSSQRMVDDGGPEIGIDTSGFPLGDFDPEISPDNKYVVFSRINTQYKNFKESLNTAHDLWIAPINGSAPARRLTSPGPISLIPDWHRGKILYTEYNEKGDYVGLVTINPDGTGEKRLEPTYINILDGGRHGKWIPR